ncbi:hypothetical protein A6X21_21485 [Planctopirus hydrillae]|uniref:Uncharacterized protein n=1 Tax=Planctopirus hydrillae TaxID=1841610 RepID=A0A1C3EFV1_9PLAN|nr:hypothetical protein A6X21_21485 [Planctopirus hydrillae]
MKVRNLCRSRQKFQSLQVRIVVEGMRNSLDGLTGIWLMIIEYILPLRLIHRPDSRFHDLCEMASTLSNTASTSLNGRLCRYRKGMFRR